MLPSESRTALPFATVAPSRFGLERILRTVVPFHGDGSSGLPFRRRTMLREVGTSESFSHLAMWLND